jgi:hypothetical protein
MIGLPPVSAASCLFKSAQTGAVIGFFVTKRRDILLANVVGSLADLQLNIEDWAEWPRMERV